MRALGTALQLLIFAIFVICYVAAIIPAAIIVALRRPTITPGPRVKTTIGQGRNIRIVK